MCGGRGGCGGLLAPKQRPYRSSPRSFTVIKIKARLGRWAEVCGDARDERHDPATSDASEHLACPCRATSAQPCYAEKKEKITPSLPSERYCTI